MSRFALLVFICLCASASALEKVASWRYVDVTPSQVDEVFKTINPFGALMDLLDEEGNKRLPQDHNVVQWAQRVADAIWMMAGKTYDLRGIPAPIMSIIKDPFPNGYVAPIFKCFKVQLGTVANSTAEQEQLDSKSTLVLSGSEPLVTYEMTIMDRVRGRLPCVYQAGHQHLQEMLAFHNIKNRGKCSALLDAQTSPPTLHLDGACSGTKLTHLEELAFVASANVVTINSGLLAENRSNPVGIAGVIAHEIAHYLRAHASFGVRESFEDWYYLAQDRPNKSVPSRRTDLVELGSALKTAGELDWIHPAFADLPLDPMTAAASDKLVDGIRGRNRWFLEQVRYEYDDKRQPLRRRFGIGEQKSTLFYTLNDVCSGQEPCLRACAPFGDPNFSFRLEAFLLRFPRGSRVTNGQVELVRRHQERVMNCLETVPVLGVKALANHDYLSLPKFGIMDWLQMAAGSKFKILEKESYRGLADIVRGLDTHLKKARNALSTAMAAQVQIYTTEEEADEIAMQWMADLGLNPSNFENLLHQMAGDMQQLKAAACDPRMQWPKVGEVSPDTCEQLKADNFLDKNGQRVYLPIMDYSLVHHPGCFRLSRINQFRKSLPAISPGTFAQNLVREAKAWRDLPLDGQDKLLNLVGGTDASCRLKVKAGRMFNRAYSWIKSWAN